MPEEMAGAAERSTAPGPRVGHLTFESPDPVAAQAWWEGIGFRLSEGLGDFFRWLRCNPIHHTLAFSRADARASTTSGSRCPTGRR